MEPHNEFNPLGRNLLNRYGAGCWRQYLQDQWEDEQRGPKQERIPTHQMTVAG